MTATKLKQPDKIEIISDNTKIIIEKQSISKEKSDAIKNKK